MYSSQESADCQLLKLLQEGTPAAFARVYDRTYKRLFAEAYAHLKTVEESEDLVQEIFIWLWQEREKLEVRTSLTGYLVRIVKYKSIDVLRKREMQQRRRSRFDFLFREDSMPPMSRMEEHELQQQLNAAIDTISSPQSRFAFRLYLEEKSGREIASEMGLKVQSVKNLLMHARKVVRRKMLRFNP